MPSNLSGWAGPLTVDDIAPIEQLREVLRAAGFNGETVREILGADSQLLARPGEAPVLRRRLEGREPLGTIVSLLVLDTPVPVADVGRAFAPLTLEQLEGLGLLESGGGLVKTRVRVVPHDDLIIVSDLTGAAHDHSPDHVAGVHNPSVTLSHLTMRGPVGTALDVGTGCGIQAILASRHSDHVVATDINGRALNFAAFNAILNGAANIELRAGSLYEPVAGEKFDLLVTNPPYVISPETAYLFRDGGLTGDTLSRDVLHGAPAVLEEGAFGAMLLSWVHPAGKDWAARLREWVNGCGCDALLLHYGTQDALTHAASWTRDRYGADPEEFEGALARWLDYLRDLEIDSIAYGGVVLRRREAGPNWVLAHKLPPSGLGPAGAHIARLFEAADFMAGVQDAASVLAERFALSEHALVRQEVELRAGEWTIDTLEMKLNEGLGFTASIDPLIAHLVAGIDGTRTLGEVVDDLAAREGTESGAFGERAVTIVRELFLLGFLERVPST